MGKKVKKVSSSKGKTVSDQSIEDSLAVFSAKRQYVVSTLSMGWQLAGVVVLPVIVGVKLDQRFDSSPSYTLASLVLAIFGAVLVIKNTVIQVDREQKEADRKGRK